MDGLACFYVHVQIILVQRGSFKLSSLSQAFFKFNFACVVRETPVCWMGQNRGVAVAHRRDRSVLATCSAMLSTLHTVGISLR